MQNRNSTKQSPSPFKLKPLNLSAKEKKQLKTFLVEALTGEEAAFPYPKVP